MPKDQDSKQLALAVARAIDDKKGSDIVIQYVGDLLSMTDWFVIATAANKRRADAIADEVAEQLREKLGARPVSREGVEEGTWILLDYGSVVVHVFQPAERDFYRLEQLWDEAPTLGAAAAGIEDPVYSERIAALLARQDGAGEEGRGEEGRDEEARTSGASAGAHDAPGAASGAPDAPADGE